MVTKGIKELVERYKYKVSDLARRISESVPDEFREVEYRDSHFKNLTLNSLQTIDSYSFLYMNDSPKKRRIYRGHFLSELSSLKSYMTLIENYPEFATKEVATNKGAFPEQDFNNIVSYVSYSKKKLEDF